MVPLHLEFEFSDGRVAGTAEQLNQLSDIEGFIRYQITVGERRSVVCVNMENEQQPSVTANNAENYYEAVYYPEQVSDFSEEEVFTPEEISRIAAEIRTYNNSRKLTFDQMHFDF